jgi:tetratricopeptide (TPR) repeat protein/predicted Ser/Thr protein kinase
MIVIGDILDGRYQVLEKIGSGGTGVIYKAWHLSLQKYVVVKKIKDDFAGSVNGRAEADILKDLHHTYLPQVYDFFQIGAQVFTVMDFIEGYSLKQYMDAGCAFDEKTLKAWFRELLEVLSYLHGQRIPIIHCDIKPANIMITQDGHVRLIDFNISLGGDDGADMIGLSREYASPEQAAKADLLFAGLDHSHVSVGNRSDLYSLGKCFDELMRLGARQGYAYTEALWRVVCTAECEAPGDRYASADVMLSRLSGLKKLDSRYLAQRRVVWTLYVSYGLCLVVAALFLLYGYGKNSEELYETKLDELRTLAESHRAADMVAAGVKMLQNDRLGRVAKKSPGEYAWILHTIGDGYFEEGNYKGALPWYRDAVSYADSGNEGFYYTDLAISEARAGNTRRAMRTLSDARSAGAEASAVALVEAEIAIEEGDAVAAASLLEESGGGGDPEVSKRAYLHLADIYMDGSLGSVDLVAAGDRLRRIPDQNDSLVLRKLGEVYGRSGDYDEALSCYKKLFEKVDPSVEDGINIAVSYGNVGRFDEGIRILETMEEDYPDDYRIPANLSVLHYDSFRESGEAGGLASAENCYRRAKGLFRGAERTGTSDAAMEMLKGIFG